MALNIKDPETDRLARELALATGESITVATRVAIEERLVRTRSKRAGPANDLRAIIERGRARATVDDRSEAAILGYDEHGLPA